MPFLHSPGLCLRGTIKFNPPGFPEIMEETASGGCHRRGESLIW